MNQILAVLFFETGFDFSFLIWMSDLVFWSLNISLLRLQEYFPAPQNDIYLIRREVQFSHRLGTLVERIVPHVWFQINADALFLIAWSEVLLGCWVLSIIKTFEVKFKQPYQILDVESLLLVLIVNFEQSLCDRLDLLHRFRFQTEIYQVVVVSKLQQTLCLRFTSFDVQNIFELLRYPQAQSWWRNIAGKCLLSFQGVNQLLGQNFVDDFEQTLLVHQDDVCVSAFLFG